VEIANVIYNTSSTVYISAGVGPHPVHRTTDSPFPETLRPQQLRAYHVHSTCGRGSPGGGDQSLDLSDFCNNPFPDTGPVKETPLLFTLASPHQGNPHNFEMLHHGTTRDRHHTI